MKMEGEFETCQTLEFRGVSSRERCSEGVVMPWLNKPWLRVWTDLLEKWFTDLCKRSLWVLTVAL